MICCLHGSYPDAPKCPHYDEYTRRITTEPIIIPSTQDKEAVIIAQLASALKIDTQHASLIVLTIKLLLMNAR